MVCRRWHAVARSCGLASVGVKVGGRRGAAYACSVLAWLQLYGAARMHRLHLDVIPPPGGAAEAAAMAAAAEALLQACAASGRLTWLRVAVAASVARTPWPPLRAGAWLGGLPALQTLHLSSESLLEVPAASLAPLTALQQCELRGRPLQLPPDARLPASLRSLVLGGLETPPPPQASAGRWLGTAAEPGSCCSCAVGAPRWSQTRRAGVGLPAQRCSTTGDFLFINFIRQPQPSACPLLTTRTLRQIAELSRLTRLALPRLRCAGSGAALAFLPALPALRELELSHCEVPPCLPRLAALTALALERVWLHVPAWEAAMMEAEEEAGEGGDEEADGAAAAMRAALAPLSALRRLALRTVVDLPRVPPVVTALPTLQHLEWRGLF